MIIKLRRNRSRASQAIVLLYISLFVNAVLGLIDYSYLRFIGKVIAGEHFTREEAEFLDTLAMGTAIPALVFHVICGIFFILWFRRAYFNLASLKCKTKFDEGWAAGAWFVPILNWFRPYQIMEDIYLNIQKILGKYEVEYDKKQLTSNFLVLWWILWVIGSILSTVSSRMLAEERPSLDTLKAAFILGIISAIVTIAAAIMAARIIKVTSSWEEKMRKAVEEKALQDEA